MARGGIEPPTYRFSGGRSYQLSYLAGWYCRVEPAELYRTLRRRSGPLLRAAEAGGTGPEPGYRATDWPSAASYRAQISPTRAECTPIGSPTTTGPAARSASRNPPSASR